MPSPSLAAVGVGGHIELRQIGAEQVHVLDGRQLKTGDAIELLLSGGHWLRGRYEWNGQTARWPGLLVECGGPWEAHGYEGRIPRAILALNPELIVRWALAG